MNDLRTSLATMVLALSLDLATRAAGEPLSASMVLNADHDPVTPGETVTYTIDYATGPDFIDSPQTLRAVIPPGLGFLAASDGGICNNSVVEWDFEAVPALERGQRQFTVEVDPAAKIGSLLTVSLENAPVDWQRFTSHVQASHPLELLVQGTPRWPNSENTVTYSISVRNAGTDVLQRAKITLSFNVGCPYPYTGSWDLGNIEPGASGTATYQMQTWFCGDIAPFLDPVIVQASFAQSSIHVRSATGLWINSADDRIVTLHVDGITPASPSSSTIETPITITGSGLSPDCRVVFRSGAERIEIPSEKIEFVSPNQINTAVAFPPGTNPWTVHMIRYPDAAQFVFSVGGSLRLVHAQTSGGAGVFRCWLQGPVGRNLSVQWSSDLVQWKDLTNFMSTAELTLVTDPTLGSERLRFYRAASRQ